MPQPPQCAGSVAVSTHVIPQHAIDSLAPPARQRASSEHPATQLDASGPSTLQSLPAGQSASAMQATQWPDALQKGDGSAQAGEQPPAMVSGAAASVAVPRARSAAPGASMPTQEEHK